MKRYLALAALFMMSLCLGGKLSAGNFGVLGGANFYTTNIREINASSMTQWHAGITYKIDLPIGFQLQPALVYNVKGANVREEIVQNLSVGYLELMVPVQWGIDLILFRPFLEVAPFIGYGLEGWGNLKSQWKDAGNKFEYGAGVGGGLQIWRFQLTARYNWNFGKLMQATDIKADMKNANFSGVSLSLALFF